MEMNLGKWKGNEKELIEVARKERKWEIWKVTPRVQGKVISKDEHSERPLEID